MIAPAAFEDLTFPEQKLLYWTKNEFNQWSRAGLSYFSSGSNIQNQPVYTTASLIHTGMGQINAGALTNTGKLYLGGYGTTDTFVLDTMNDTTSSLGALSSNCQSAFYNSFTNNVYLINDGTIRVINTADNTSQTITNPFSGQCIGYGISMDGNYAYISNFFASDSIAKLNMVATGSVTAFSGTFTGDPLKGTMGWDNKMYMGCGGGSTGIKVYDPATNTVANLSVPGQSNVADDYRDIVQHYDGYLYSFPGYHGSYPIIRIGPATSTITNVIASVAQSRIFSLCVGADGRIYGVGNGDAPTYGVAIYNPANNSYVVESISAVKNWRLIKMGARGDLYMFNTAGECWKKTLINGGGLQKPLQEYNGITSRFQTT